MSEPLLVLDAVTKEYVDGALVRAVSGVSLTVERGEIVLIMGPNGSGKTTLLSMAGGLVRPTSGRVRIEGRALSELSDRALTDFRLRRIGFVFQTFRLLDALSVRENVQLVGEIARGDAPRLRAEEMLERVGARHLADRSPRVLSGGEKQRVAIARALTNRPSLILADEPTGSLDSAAGQATIALLAGLAREEECAVVIVSHDPRITEHADRVIRMADGRLAD
jgi:putative ABC transport system ATP-binding protein